MIAVFKTGGKQYCVKPGQILKVEKIEGKKGDSLTFNEILAVGNNAQNTIGNPIIKDASIEAKILDQIRGEKITVFKKRRRKNYHRTHGHRQFLTVLRIESINKGSKKEVADTVLKNNKITKPQTKIKELKEKTKTEKKSIEKQVAVKKMVKKKKSLKKTIVKKITKGKK